jgi:hypothetical protein
MRDQLRLSLLQLPTPASFAQPYSRVINSFGYFSNEIINFERLVLEKIVTRKYKNA